jgi:formylglycine-generating enzyme required for sulfatase activity
MTVIPAGTFMMGSPANEPGRATNEGPQHTVTIARQFAVGRFAVTRDEWSACVDDGGCNGYTPSISKDWNPKGLPVDEVSWGDANAYVAWLTKKTGKAYRLLSDAEYEYATRAGTRTVFPWGDAVGSNKANCDGCGGQWENKQTSPVGSFAANGFGLYDMVGNVQEWTQDCFHDDYQGAPADGAPWADTDCIYRVIRGASFQSKADELRSANRGFSKYDGRTGYWWGGQYTLPGYETTFFTVHSGFRVARTLADH